MSGYLTIPNTIFCRSCKVCGARPVLEADAAGFYVVKCPTDSRHYHTRAGLIDIEDWNRHNITSFIQGCDINAQISVK